MIKIPRLDNAGTADPAGLTDGDAWLRTDLAAVKYRLDGTSIEPLFGLHAHRLQTSNWYSIGQAGSITQSGNPTANSMYLTPFWPGRKCTIKQIAYEIVTLSAGGTTDVMRFGMYNSDNNGVPSGAALVDWGTFNLMSPTTTGVKVLDVTDTALDPTLYWIASVRQTTGSPSTQPVITRQGPDTKNKGLIFQTAATPNIGTNDWGGWLQTGVSGALPTIGSISVDGSSSARLLVQML